MMVYQRTTIGTFRIPLGAACMLLLALSQLSCDDEVAVSSHGAGGAGVGGSGAGARTAISVKSEQHGRPYSIELTLPPLGALFLERH